LFSSKAKQNKTKQNKTKQNKTKQNKTKQNKTKRNETKRNETKRNETKRNETKRNETKRNETKQSKAKQSKAKQNKTMMNHPKAKFDTWSFDEPVKSLSSWNPLSEADIVVGGHYKAEEKETSDLVFVCHYAGDAKAADDEMDGAFSTILEDMINNGEYPNVLAKAGSMTPTLLIVGEKKKTKKCVFVGLGKAGEASSNNGSSLGKAIASRCIEEGASQVQTASVLFPASVWSPLFFKDVSTAFYSSLYVDNRFRGSLESIRKPKNPAPHLKRLRVDYYFEHEHNNDAVVPSNADKDDAIAVAVAEGKTIAGGVHLAKDIVNAPHNVLNSLSLADLARKIASESNGSLTCQILDKDDCERRGMGAYLGVARASETPPQFIHLSYTPPPPGADDDETPPGTNKVVGVVGKGLLFDTGGYNIKTSMMELMKFDCGGAAAVLGAAKTIGALKPPGVECHFVVAACENMINDRGIVPSDVLVASNGVTIEVANTDAEGRLTLADALVYCDKELQCEKIIELSTLTGSCMVALGKVRVSLGKHTHTRRVHLFYYF
jgi:leucyl aminopeptidase